MNRTLCTGALSSLFVAFVPAVDIYFFIGLPLFLSHSLTLSRDCALYGQVSENRKIRRRQVNEAAQNGGKSCSLDL